MLLDESDRRISFGDRNEYITLSNITYEDRGTYECLASNKFRIDSAVYMLNVVGTFILFFQKLYRLKSG